MYGNEKDKKEHEQDHVTESGHVVFRHRNNLALTPEMSEIPLITTSGLEPTRSFQNKAPVVISFLHQNLCNTLQRLATGVISTMQTMPYKQ